MDATKICNMLNEERVRDPMLFHAMTHTVWATAHPPAHFDATQSGEMYLTGVLGVVNACLRESGSEHVIRPKLVGEDMVFVPEKIQQGEENEEVPPAEED